MPFILVTLIGIADLGGAIARGASAREVVSLVGEVSDEEESSSELVGKSGWLSATKKSRKGLPPQRTCQMCDCALASGH